MPIGRLQRKGQQWQRAWSHSGLLICRTQRPPGSAARWDEGWLNVTPCDDTDVVGTDTEQDIVTRGVVFALDPTPAQERLLRSYAGAASVAYNWAIGAVSANLSQRRNEREAGVPDESLTSPVSWSAYSLGKAWNDARDEAAPWWREVSMHAFRSGTASAAVTLKNFSDSKKGDRRGRRVGFPRPKSRRRSTPSISFVEINHQLSWLRDDRHGIRLMLPQSSPDPDIRRRRSHLEWIHSTESTRRLYRLVESGRAASRR